MICYRDTTFCTFWKDCKDGNDCTRALTEEVKEQAARWWKDWNLPEIGPPICQFAAKPDCWTENIKTVGGKVTDESNSS